MLRLIRGMAIKNTKLIGQRMAFAALYCLARGEESREVVRANTVAGALKRKLIHALPYSPQRWEFRLSDKGRRIVEALRDADER